MDPTIFIIQDLKHIHEAHKESVSELMDLMSTNLFNSLDPKKVFEHRSGMLAKGIFGETKQKNLSGIVYGEFHGVTYIPFFFTKRKRQGLGSRVLLELEKMFFERKSNPITGMVVFATKEMEAYYLKRGFANLEKPRFAGYSVNGKKLREKINGSGILKLFPANEVVILYKMVSEKLSSTFISSFNLKFDSIDLKEVADMNCLKNDINKLDWRYKPSTSHPNPNRPN